MLKSSNKFRIFTATILYHLFIKKKKHLTFPISTRNKYNENTVTDYKIVHNPTYIVEHVPVLFHLKSSFRAQDIQIFMFLSSLIFSPVSHCFRGWSKKNLKVYDIINCLSKNLTTHFVWYLEKKLRCDTETLSIDRELNKECFYGKMMPKMCTKS